MEAVRVADTPRFNAPRNRQLPRPVGPHSVGEHDARLAASISSFSNPPQGHVTIHTARFPPSAISLLGRVRADEGGVEYVALKKHPRGLKTAAGGDEG
jgi:hypothetical protein